MITARVSDIDENEDEPNLQFQNEEWRIHNLEGLRFAVLDNIEDHPLFWRLQAQATYDEDRERLLETGFYNFFNQTDLGKLVFHMRKHIQLIEKAANSADEKDTVRSIYGGKIEMTRHISYLALTYLRGIRCYHLRNLFYPEDKDPVEVDRDQVAIWDKIQVNKFVKSSGEERPDQIITVDHLCESLNKILIDFLLQQTNQSVRKLVELKKSF